jgi:signal transduction histidine kinase
MLVTYSLIIILTFSIFGVVIINNYRTRSITNEENRLFQTANIVADTYKRNLDDIIYGRMLVRSYASQANARILILDAEKNVVVDNFNSYLNKILNNEEIRSSLRGIPKSGIYGEVMQLTVPIRLNTGLENEIIGVVLVSSSLNSINNDIEGLKQDIIRISEFAILIALILTAITATSLTKSLRILTMGVRKISSGQLGYQIERDEKGDVGKLISTFNDMSMKLNHIEKNRKSVINSISHELKTPLTSINALIDSLLIGNNSIDIYNEYLEDIKGETNRMGELVNFLMSSIKLEEINLDIKKINISGLLNDTIKFITPYANSNNVIIKSDLDENIYVYCDGDKIREVFLNLIENAVKYKDDDKDFNYVDISIKRQHSKILVTIEDNGLGINEDKLKNIFNRGFRVLEHTLSGIEGYGIGLSLVKNIIDRHNWTITVNSTQGVGSIFSIEI